MSQNMKALKWQLLQSKLSVLMPSIKFVNKCIQTQRFSTRRFNWQNSDVTQSGISHSTAAQMRLWVSLQRSSLVVISLYREITWNKGFYPSSRLCPCTDSVQLVLQRPASYTWPKIHLRRRHMSRHSSPILQRIGMQSLVRYGADVTLLSTVAS